MKKVLFFLLMGLLIVSCTKKDGFIETSDEVASNANPNFKSGVLIDTLAGQMPIHQLSFPKDHGGHVQRADYLGNSQLLELWYCTGIIETFSGKKFSYNVSFYNQRVPKEDATEVIAWTRMAIQDIDKNQTYYIKPSFYNNYTISENGLHLEFSENFKLASLLSNSSPIPLRGQKAIPALFGSYTLKGKGVDIKTGTAMEVKFALRPAAKKLIHKGESVPGIVAHAKANDTYAYSVPRLKTMGKITLGDSTYMVKASKSSSWLEHKWSTITPGIDCGWEWWTVNLKNGDDIWVLNIIDPATRQSTHSYITARVNGQMVDHVTNYGDLDVLLSDDWTSVFGIQYPMKQNINVPELGLGLSISTMFDDQDTGGGYQGACNVFATIGGEQVDGNALVEFFYPPSY